MEIDVTELMYTALRASFVYAFLLIIVRLLGKREVGNTSAFDLIVALILGEVGRDYLRRCHNPSGCDCYRCCGAMALGQFMGKLQEPDHR
jgi:hypothetical protein